MSLKVSLLLDSQLAPREVNRLAAMAAEQVVDEGVPGAASGGSSPSASQ